MSEKHAQDGPQVPHPSSVNQTPISAQNVSNTTTSQTPDLEITAVPAIPPTTTISTPTQGQDASPQQTQISKLNNGDPRWKFKVALYTILVIIDIIGIGCIGWAVATSNTLYSPSILLTYTLIPLSVSALWSCICVIVFLIRKRPVHPGARVALDLLLWLAFILAAMMTLYSVVSLMNWGADGEIWGLDSRYGFYSSAQGYKLAQNGTWVWTSNLNRYPSSTRSNERDCDADQSWAVTGFANCAEEDAFVNKLWREKPNRFNVELTGLVCQFLAIVLHFTLFVWACVDTHQHNRGSVSKDAEKLAAEIVMKMVRDGAIVQTTPGHAHGRPVAQQQFYTSQGVYANQQMSPQQVHFQQVNSQPVGPSNQVAAAAARYA